MTSPSLDPARSGRVAVLMGGPSAEHDISVKTGHAVLAALAARGVDAKAVIWDDDIVRPLVDGAFDRVFNALHGRGGEDGTIQGLLELLGLPYSGSGVLASALAMDKGRTKALWRAAGIPTPDSVTVGPGAGPDAILERLGLPVFVKPCSDGSSFGISKVSAPDDLAAALALAGRYDSRILVEQAIAGPEVTIGILEGRALPAIRLETDREFYDYEAKYVGHQTRYVLPAGLSAAAESELGNLALRAFAEIGAHGWGRVDMMLDEDGRPFLLELNTVPGLTDHSLVPMAAAAAGIDFETLVLTILASSETRPV